MEYYQTESSVRTHPGNLCGENKFEMFLWG